MSSEFNRTAEECGVEESSGWGVFWGVVSTTAVMMGLVVALLAGYFLGHFSNPKTKTVVVHVAPPAS